MHQKRSSSLAALSASSASKTIVLTSIKAASEGVTWSISQHLSVTYHIGSGTQQMTLPSLSSPSDEAWSADQDSPLNQDMMRFRIVEKASAMEKL
jgi:hypothetical protein